MLPSTQLVDAGYMDAGYMDAGYMDAEDLATSRAPFGSDLVGPTRGDYRWQARQLAYEDAPFDRSRFASDWAAHQVTCPQGRTSANWTPAQDRRPRAPRAVINVAFAAADCRHCPSHARCTTQIRRGLTLHPQAHEEALRAARARERTPAFALTYAQ